MNERDFELLLLDDMSELPPTDDLTNSVNPWRTAMNRILWGIALVTVTLNFWNLDVILPAIGIMLMLLGFRTMCSENRWFRVCFFLTIVRAVWFLVHLFFDATIYSGSYGESNFAMTGTYLMLAVGFTTLLCLRNGIRAVQVRAGLEPHVGSANALLIFYLVMVALAVINFEGFTVWLLIIAYYFILRGLFMLSKELDDAGYVIRPKAVRFTDRTLTVSCGLVIAFLLAAGYLFFNQYPMQWQAAEPQTETEAHRQELLELGFPEYVLKDLTDEEVLLCRDADKVHVDTEDCPTNDGYETSEVTSQGIHIYTAYDEYELRITAVAVEPEDQSKDWVIFHHFQWLSDPGWRGTDAVQLWPAYRSNSGWSPGTHLSGQVLYNDGDITYAAPCYALGHVTGTSESMFFGEVTATDIVAAFSLPRGGENCRGYICYTTRISTPGYLLSSWCNYYYQDTLLWFPVRPAAEVIRPGISYHPDGFQMADSALQMSYDIDQALEEGIYEYSPID